VTIIFVPRPSKNAMNPDRPVSSLLLAQIQHLQHAERRLPLRYRTEIYTRAIRTEGEAARYIREVTEAIHRAHADAVAKRAKGTSVRKSRSKARTKSNKDEKRKTRRFS
jgi:hypothetical protein